MLVYLLQYVKSSSPSGLPAPPGTFCSDIYCGTWCHRRLVLPNLIVAKVHPCSRPGNTLLTIHVGKLWTAPFGTLCLWHPNSSWTLCPPICIVWLLCDVQTDWPSMGLSSADSSICIAWCLVLRLGMPFLLLFVTPFALDLLLFPHPVLYILLISLIGDGLSGAHVLILPPFWNKSWVASLIPSTKETGLLPRLCSVINTK